MSRDSAANPSRGVRILGLGFAVLFVLLCGSALFVYLGWHGKPAHWVAEQQRRAALPDTQRQAISESLRNRLLTQWSGSGEKMPATAEEMFGRRKTIHIPFDDLNTWIQTEGLSLLEAIGVEVPDTACTAMVDSPGDGLVRISFEIASQGIQQVIALTFQVTIADDGTRTSTLKQATAGRLPLPIDTALTLIDQQTEQRGLIDLMQGTPMPPIIIPIDPSDDGLRDGKLVGLNVTDDALIITRETVRRTGE